MGRTLDRLLARVTRLGHSSSLVSCRVTSEPPAPTRVPSDEVGEGLRGVRQGQLAELERQFARHHATRPRSLPYTDVWYRAITESLQMESPQEPNTAAEWLVFELAHDARFFPATRVVELAQAMRSAILHYAEDPIPEALSGHGPTGTPSAAPHIAFLPPPLCRPSLCRRSASGNRRIRAQGAARRGAPGVVSRDWDLGARFCITALAAHPGNSGRCSSVPPARSFRPGFPASPTSGANLRGGGFRQPPLPCRNIRVGSCEEPGQPVPRRGRWRKRRWRRHADTSGCPEPTAVHVSLNAFLTGARAATHFPAFSQKGRDGRSIRRQLVHAALTFEAPVAGPLMLGTGRFLGLGLMRPARMTEGDLDE